MFDSSVLIAAVVESHPKHKSALSFLTRAKNNDFEFFVSAHSLLEIYSVLTSAPFNPKITPTIAKRLIDNNIKSAAEVIYLTENDYFKIIDKMDAYNFAGGIVYDAIILECALKAKVDEILTLNPKDFSRLPTENIKTTSA